MELDRCFALLLTCFLHSSAYPQGSECEYRHSEYARMNPRDCFYWMNGNCLNPKCGFRHPVSF